MTNPSDIKALVFDVDGVMTDGSLTALADGDLLRTYNAKDTFGIRMALMGGLEVAVITGGESAAIYKRFTSCGVKAYNIFMRSRNKLIQFEEFCRNSGIRPSQVAYVGDDLPDVGVISACGLGVAPADACEEAKAAADLVSKYPGGKGCIRDLVESILKAQGKWDFDPVEYEKRY